MSRNYKINDQNKAYFATFTVLNCMDVFIRNEYRKIFIESIQHCQQHKGLSVFAWCLMTSHAHLIVASDGQLPLQGIIRDTKSFTSRHIRKLIEDKSALDESRREWLFGMMQEAGYKNPHNNDFQFWQQHSHPIELNNQLIFEQKVNYIHQNPVEAGFVAKPEDWLYSSAIDYTEHGKGILELAYF